ncbi:YpiF family protein [Salibacterium sp. K-3]
MRWSTEDIPSFVKERQYVDTALIPLLPVEFGDGIRQSAAMNEFITVMTAEIEKQFRGRILLTPAYTYLAGNGHKPSAAEINKWIEAMKTEKLKHIILLTADASWKKAEHELDALLIWMPLVPLENMEASYKKQVISEQMKQLLPLVMDKWKEEGDS